MFNALLLSQVADKKTHAELVAMDPSRLPDAATFGVTVDVSWSTLNF